jgi:hypothetical protein
MLHVPAAPLTLPLLPFLAESADRLLIRILCQLAAVGAAIAK